MNQPRGDSIPFAMTFNNLKEQIEIDENFLSASEFINNNIVR